MSGLTIGSLFAGIGGLELGLERGIGNGAHTIWQVEQNAYCRAVLAKHWPDAIRYEDVRDVGRRNLAAVDVLCGGFPCQDVSLAGRRAGVVKGTRSGLWYEFSRIIRELRPSYVVVENVAALLTLGLDAVLGELAESGYDAEWSCVQAIDVGAPHIRDRVFVLAYPNPHNQGLEGRFSDSLADAAGSGEGKVLRPRRGLSLQSGGGSRSSRGSWEPEPDVGRVAHGVPARVDRLRALGNAVVPAVAEVVGRLIAEREYNLATQCVTIRDEETQPTHTDETDLARREEGARPPMADGAEARPETEAA